MGEERGPRVWKAEWRSRRKRKNRRERKERERDEDRLG